MTSLQQSNRTLQTLLVNGSNQTVFERSPRMFEPIIMSTPKGVSYILPILLLSGCATQKTKGRESPATLYEIRDSGLHMKGMLFHQGVLTQAIAAEEARRFLSEPLNHSAAFAELAMVEEKVGEGDTSRHDDTTRNGGCVCGYSHAALRGATPTQGPIETSRTTPAHRRRCLPHLSRRPRTRKCHNRHRDYPTKRQSRSNQVRNKDRFYTSVATGDPQLQTRLFECLRLFQERLGADLRNMSGTRKSATTAYQGHDLAVEVRQDSWFVSMSYPLYFPFAPDNGPGVYADLVGRVIAPSVARYYRQTRTECHLFAAGTPPTCETYGRREPTQ